MRRASPWPMPPSTPLPPWRISLPISIPSPGASPPCTGGGRSWSTRPTRPAAWWTSSRTSGDSTSAWTSSGAWITPGSDTATCPGFREALNEEEDIFFVPTTLGARRVYGVYFTTKEAHHKVDSLFNSLHFVRIRLEDPPGGTVDNATAELNAQVEAAQAAVAQVGQELEELRRQEREHILSSYSYLR